MKLLLLLPTFAFLLLSACASNFDGRVEGYYKTPAGSTYGGSYELKNRSGFAK